MTQAAIGSIAPLVKVGGSDLAAVVLNSMIGLRISCGLRIPSRAKLDFLDDGFAISAGATFHLGTPLVITTSAGEALFTGAVTGVQLDIDRGAPNLTVIADDAAYKMTLGNKVRTFTSMTYSDVVRQIAGEYGISATVGATSGVHEYLLQSDSDFGFVTEMADRVGFDWWVDASGTLQFQQVGSAQGQAPTLDWDGTLRSFTVRATALHPGRVTVMGWDPAGKQPMTVQSTPVDHQPDASLVAPFLRAGDLSSNNKVQTADRMYAKQSDGTGFATSAAGKAAFGAFTATGVCLVNPGIKVGGQVVMSDCGPASGTYPVTEVEHSYSLRGFETRFTAGDREPTSLVDTLTAGRTSSFRQDSLVVGVVTNLGDASSPKGYVKVRYPTLGSQIESAWARVVAAGAGASRGMTFLPEVNDEVLIGFEGGDVTRPLVLGGLYNGNDVALDYGTANGQIAKRQIVSRLGHVIELGDGEGPADQHIWLTLAGGEFFVKLAKDGMTAQVPSGKPVAIQAGDSSIKIDASGNIAVSGQKITITGQQDVEISGLNIKIKGNVNVEASAGAQLKLSGSAAAELSAGGQTSVKGAMVMIN